MAQGAGRGEQRAWRKELGAKRRARRAWRGEQKIKTWLTSLKIPMTKFRFEQLEIWKFAIEISNQLFDLADLLIEKKKY